MVVSSERIPKGSSLVNQCALSCCDKLICSFQILIKYNESSRLDILIEFVSFVGKPYEQGYRKDNP